MELDPRDCAAIPFGIFRAIVSCASLAVAGLAWHTSVRASDVASYLVNTDLANKLLMWGMVFAAVALLPICTIRRRPVFPWTWFAAFYDRNLVGYWLFAKRADNGTVEHMTVRKTENIHILLDGWCNNRIGFAVPLGGWFTLDDGMWVKRLVLPGVSFARFVKSEVFVTIFQDDRAKVTATCETIIAFGEAVLITQDHSSGVDTLIRNLFYRACNSHIAAAKRNEAVEALVGVALAYLELLNSQPALASRGAKESVGRMLLGILPETDPRRNAFHDAAFGPGSRN